MAVAVAGRRDLGDEAQEHGPVLFVLHHPVSILRQLLQEDGDGFVPLDLDVAVGADQDALPAADAFGGVNHRLLRFQINADGLLGAVGHAVAAAGALFFRDLGGDIGVLGQFAPAGRASHGQVFQRPAETGHLVELEVGHYHHALRLHHGFRQKDALEVLLLNGHLHLRLAGEAVGDDQGCFHHRIGKTVFNGRGQVAHRLGSGAHVDGIGIGEERPAPVLPEGVHYPAHEIGADVGGVALLPEMELHGHQRPLLLALNDGLQIHRDQQLLEFLDIGLLDGGPQVHEKNLAGHVVLANSLVMLIYH